MRLLEAERLDARLALDLAYDPALPAFEVLFPPLVDALSIGIEDAKESGLRNDSFLAVPRWCRFSRDDHRSFLWASSVKKRGHGGGSTKKARSRRLPRLLLRNSKFAY